jgi:hypothetical protein
MKRVQVGLIVAAFLVSPAFAQKKFATPDEAANALIAAAAPFDVEAMKEILGPDNVDIVVTEDRVNDENNAKAFAALALQRKRIVVEGKHATLNVGDDDWPLPIPLVKTGKQWRFDPAAARKEILFRRIGTNELDAIEVCRGYVEAQEEYASEKRDGSPVPQYAQRVISTPGRQDGLAWSGPDGSWQGPVGEAIASAIAEGYTDKIDPYHGYYFKILKGQGPHAPMGAMNFLVKGVMIGGFALVAAPAEYRVTGVKTFIVSHDGVVYQKDLGPGTTKIAEAMKAYNPDSTWRKVEPEPSKR